MKMRTIRTLVEVAPPVSSDPSDTTRLDYFRATFGQLVGWMTDPDLKFLVDWLPERAMHYPRNMRIVETGTFAGSTARGLIVLTCGGVITCIDNWRDVHVENPREQWHNTLRAHFDLRDYATLIEGDHKEIGATWSKPIDLLLIDADHAYEAALADMKNFASKIIVGGYCLVDDINLPDVARACAEFFKTPSWKQIRYPNGDSEGKLACWERAS